MIQFVMNIYTILIAIMMEMIVSIKIIKFIKNIFLKDGLHFLKVGHHMIVVKPLKYFTLL